MRRLLTTSCFLLAMILIHTHANAQDATTVVKKGLFHPFYFRAGLMSGVLTNHSGTAGTLTLRTEYGLSNKFSIVGDAMGANAASSSLSGGQGSLSLRYQPFTFGKVQLYASGGIGAGSINDGKGHCHHSYTLTAPVPTTDTSTPPSNKHHIQGFGTLQIGANLKLSSHFFAQGEAGFQSGFSRHMGPGAASFRIGMSYQF